MGMCEITSDTSGEIKAFEIPMYLAENQLQNLKIDLKPLQQQMFGL